jgi:hypothetical protein
MEFVNTNTPVRRVVQKAEGWYVEKLMNDGEWWTDAKVHESSTRAYEAIGREVAVGGEYTYAR